METLWTNEQLSIAEIVETVDSGVMALPRFQRNFVWSSPAQISFLAAVLRNLPSGALLVLEVDPKDIAFAPKELDGAPDLSDASPPERLILDGQQRITTLYRAFHPSSGLNALVNLHQVFHTKSFLDEHLEISKKAPGSIAEQAERGVVALHDLVDHPKMAGWYRTYVEHHLDGDQDRIEDLMRTAVEFLPGAETDKSHLLPLIKIKKGAPISAVVNVFEGINRRGTRLNGFDLMVARLYRKTPSGTYYDLRDAWDEELAKHPGLERLGFDVDRDGLIPLQIIALSVSRLSDDVRPSGVRGVKQSDILELPPGQVLGDEAHPGPIPDLDLERAFHALAQAVAFLRDHCGVRERQMLPQDSMLVPLADQFLQPAAKRLSNDQLKRWFFSSGLLMRYYGSVNSYVESDTRQLRAWKDSEGEEIPDAVKQLTPDYVQGLSLTQGATREGRILDRSVMALLVAQGALDWRAGQFALQTIDERLEIHHAVPTERLKKIIPRGGERNPIAIRTPLTQQKNGSFRDKSPTDVHALLGGDAEVILKSHRFDPDLFSAFTDSKKKLNHLLADRESRLKELIVSGLNL